MKIFNHEIYMHTFSSNKKKSKNILDPAFSLYGLIDLYRWYITHIACIGYTFFTCEKKEQFTNILLWLDNRLITVQCLSSIANGFNDKAFSHMLLLLFRVLIKKEFVVSEEKDKVFKYG